MWIPTSVVSLKFDNWSMLALAGLSIQSPGGFICGVLNIQQVHPTKADVAETVKHNTPVSDPCMSVSVDSVQKPSLNILGLSQAILRHPCRLLKLVIRLADVHADAYATLKRPETLN